MSIPRIVNAMEYIDDNLVSNAVTYVPKKRKQWMNWKTFAACAAVIAIVIGVIPFLNNGTNAPDNIPFVLTAYAAGIDNTVSAVEMKEGESIPVTFFEANNGIKGFVFSHRATTPKNHVSLSIMTDGSQIAIGQQIEAINGLELSKENIYVFYIPKQDQPAPYSVPLTMEDEASNTLALLNVVIEETAEGYTARIDSFTVYEKTTKPVK
jgi:hypothetical protein